MCRARTVLGCLRQIVRRNTLTVIRSPIEMSTAIQRQLLSAEDGRAFISDVTGHPGLVRTSKSATLSLEPRAIAAVCHTKPLDPEMVASGFIERRPDAAYPPAPNHHCQV